MKSSKRITLVFVIFVVAISVVVCFYTFRDIIKISLFSEEDAALEAFVPDDDWLPFAIDNPIQEMNWLTPYSPNPQPSDLDSESKQMNISDTDKGTDLYSEDDDYQEDSQGDYQEEQEDQEDQEDNMMDEIPTGYPEKLVPVYEPEFFSQSGFNNDENSYFVYFDCSRSYNAAIDFYRSTFSNKPKYSENADSDEVIFQCLLSKWSVRVKVCDYYDEHSCYIEIDLLIVR